VLSRLGVLDSFLACHPFRICRFEIHVGRRKKRATLDEPAYGLSRYAFDHILWERAVRAGAVPGDHGTPDIIATGRPAGTRLRSDRLFGFKAHFEGPVDDAVELYFLERAYIGISCVEGGRTNVCGLAPEDLLTSLEFRPERIFERHSALKQRVDPLAPAMDWIFTGPLEFLQNWSATDAYYAGDALSFVDPFTGSGLLSATLTGSLAGYFAANKRPVTEYVNAARFELEEPFLYASMLRRILSSVWAERLLPVAPGRLLFRLTRPR
jgi:flavin-dependent dehydrogenase